MRGRNPGITPDVAAADITKMSQQRRRVQPVRDAFLPAPEGKLCAQAVGAGEWWGVEQSSGRLAVDQVSAGADAIRVSVCRRVGQFAPARRRAAAFREIQAEDAAGSREVFEQGVSRHLAVRTESGRHVNVILNDGAVVGSGVDELERPAESGDDPEPRGSVGNDQGRSETGDVE